MLKFSKVHQHSNDWRTIWSAEGNEETVYDITKQNALYYVTIHQYGRFIQDTGSFAYRKDAVKWANQDNDYLDGI
jgi:hypothetical protein